MSGTSQQRRQRRREVERFLAQPHLARGPRRIFDGGGPTSEAGETVVDLRPLLEGSGVAFALFGRYLASRGDLLSAADCLALEQIPDEAPPAPGDEVVARLTGEWGFGPGEIFRTFEAEPHVSRLLYQVHRAELPDGRPVEVRLRHAGTAARIAADFELLELLRPVLASRADSRLYDEVLADFRHTTESLLDFNQQAEALELLARDARDEVMVVPRVHRDLSTSRVLTLELLSGTPLAELAVPRRIDAEDLARRIALLWLQQTLTVGVLPLDAELMELSDGRLAVTGGLCASLPPAARVSLWDYLRFTAQHVPDRATLCLLREMSKLDRGAREGELHTRLRQVVPFRDGAWTEAGESLAEYAVLHWRFARRAGFRARPHLLRFYRGLFQTARTARRFSPEGDALGEALENLQWIAGWNQLRQFLEPMRLGTTAEGYLRTFLELPQKLDKALQAATGEGGLTVRPAHVPRRRRNAVTAVACLALLLAAWALVAPGFTAALGTRWAEGLTAAVFLGLGALLLGAVRRTR